MYKPLALFYMPRSGSSPVAQLIGEYLRQHEGKYYGGEFLNPYAGYPELRDGKISFRKDQIHPTPKTNFKLQVFPELEQIELNRRWKLVFEHYQQIFFKFGAPELNPHTRSWMGETFEILKLVRRNRLEHYLSFMVSTTSKLFYKEGGLGIPVRSLRADRSFAVRFHRLEREHLHVFYPDARRIYFEDFLDLGPVDFLRSLGLTKPFDLAQLRLPDIQNPPDKLSLFQNPDELLAWFHEPSEEVPERPHNPI